MRPLKHQMLKGESSILRLYVTTSIDNHLKAHQTLDNLTERYSWLRSSNLSQTLEF